MLHCFSLTHYKINILGVQLESESKDCHTGMQIRIISVVLCRGKGKVKQTYYRSVQALMVPGG